MGCRRRGPRDRRPSAAKVGGSRRRASGRPGIAGGEEEGPPPPGPAAAPQTSESRRAAEIAARRPVEEHRRAAPRGLVAQTYLPGCVQRDRADRSLSIARRSSSGGGGMIEAAAAGPTAPRRPNREGAPPRADRPSPILAAEGDRPVARPRRDGGSRGVGPRVRAEVESPPLTLATYSCCATTASDRREGAPAFSASRPVSAMRCGWPPLADHTNLCAP